MFKWLSLKLIKFYQYFISPLLGSVCRFEPSCSSYAFTSISKHGILLGSYYTLRRLMRCQPWCEGGYDPPK